MPLQLNFGGVSFVDDADAPGAAILVAEALERCFREHDASTWFKALDTRGVPCEVSTTEFEERLFDDPEMLRSRGRVFTAASRRRPCSTRSTSRDERRYHARESQIRMNVSGGSCDDVHP